MANVIDETKTPSATRNMFGRKVIKTNVTEITDKNVISVLRKALEVHALNRSEIDYLWEYYKGNQPILKRIKDIRPEICNKVVENRANEIVSFKKGYVFGEPIQYVSRSNDDSVVEAINQLNELMISEDKESKDQEVGEWSLVCGTAYRMVISVKATDIDDAPFNIYTLDPRDTFVVYSNEVGNKPMLGVKYSLDDNDVYHYSVYSKNHYWLIEGEQIIESKSLALGMIPIFEYPANNARLGAFEIVLPILDAINNIASNRMDGVEQAIQAFIKFVNCDITAEDFTELKDLGAIKVKSVEGQQADVDVVKTDLNQDQTQTLKNDLYDAVLTICGIPNRNGGSSTSDTGAATIIRDGWTAAEGRAKDTEQIFKRSEKQMLKLILKILREKNVLDLRLSEINMKFTRRNYEAIQSKSQVLIQMLGCEKIDPQLAFEASGMFIDSESAYTQSMKHYKDYQAEQQKLASSQNQNNPSNQSKTVDSSGQ